MKNKNQKQRINAEWKNIYIKRDTAKLLMQFKLDHELITYDQAINLMYDMMENKK